MIQPLPRQPLVFVFGKVLLDNEPVVTGRLFGSVGDGASYHTTGVSQGKFTFLKIIQHVDTKNSFVILTLMTSDNKIHDLITNYYIQDFNKPIWYPEFNFRTGHFHHINRLVPWEKKTIK